MKYSQNDRAKGLLGLRPEGIPLDWPSDLGYRCPIGRNHHLEWSEYNGFIWCRTDNLDIPSFFCINGISIKDDRDLDVAITIFLDIVEDIRGKK